jgi:hypothetical protein
LQILVSKRIIAGMATSPVIGIGNSDAQEAFIQAFQPFLNEYSALHPLIETAFLGRVLEPPSAETVASVADLAEDHPQVLAIDDKYKAELTVYMLCRIAVDDYSEILVLAVTAGVAVP